MGRIVGLTFAEGRRPAKDRQGAEGKTPAKDRRPGNGGAKDAGQAETPPECNGA